MWLINVQCFFGTRADMHTTKHMTMIIFASRIQQAIIMKIQSVCWRSMRKVKDNSFDEQIRPNNITQWQPKCWLFCALSKFGLPPELSAKESKAVCSERARRVRKNHTSSHMCVAEMSNQVTANKLTLTPYQQFCLNQNSSLDFFHSAVNQL